MSAMSMTQSLPLEQAIDLEICHKSQPVLDFNETCSLAIAFGVAGMKYGVSSSGIERFLEKMVESLGFCGFFRATQSELLCCFRESKSPESVGLNTHTQLVKISSGWNLQKLAMITELAKKLLEENLSYQETIEALDEIEKMPDPWNRKAVASAFMGCGGSLAMVFGGGWWDVLLGAISALIVFCITDIFSRFGVKNKIWINGSASFSCCAVSMIGKEFIPTIDTAMLTLSGVMLLLPSYRFLVGTAEIVSGHVSSGISRMVEAFVQLLWLVSGYLLAKNLFSLNHQEEGVDHEVVPISPTWNAIFLPVFMLSVNIYFQNSKRDIPWALLCMVVAYSTSCLAGMFTDKNLTFLPTMAMTIFANTWARKMDRPNTLVLLPSFVMEIGGSFGFLGIIHIAKGDTFQGTSQFLTMLHISLLIAVGVLAGNTLVPPRATLYF